MTHSRSRIALGAALLGAAGLALSACGGASEAASVSPAANGSKPPASSAQPAASGSSSATAGQDGYDPSQTGEGAAATGGKPGVYFTIKTKKPVFFITIDDGAVKQKAALDYVKSRQLPVTTFLYNGVVDGKYSYFKEFSAYDAVQNHTMDHKALSKKSTDVNYQVCKAQETYAAKVGTKPWILRPPYGAGMYSSNTAAQRNRILTTAASCGIKHIAMWNVTIDAKGKVEFADGTKLHAGDIVLLHFEGDVAANLRKAVALGKAAGLTPAPLSKYLPR